MEKQKFTKDLVHGWKKGNCDNCEIVADLACFILDGKALHECAECVYSKYRVRI